MSDFFELTSKMLTETEYYYDLAAPMNPAKYNTMGFKGEPINPLAWRDSLVCKETVDLRLKKWQEGQPINPYAEVREYPQEGFNFVVQQNAIEAAAQIYLKAWRAADFGNTTELFFELTSKRITEFYVKEMVRAGLKEACQKFGIPPSAEQVWKEFDTVRTKMQLEEQCNEYD